MLWLDGSQETGGKALLVISGVRDSLGFVDNSRAITCIEEIKDTLSRLGGWCAPGAALHTGRLPITRAGLPSTDPPHPSSFTLNSTQFLLVPGISANDVIKAGAAASSKTSPPRNETF